MSDDHGDIGGRWERGVVVGVDGSAEGYRALDWALAVADRHDAQLTVSHAEPAPVGPTIPRPSYDRASWHDEGDVVLRAALDRVGARPPGAKKVEVSVSIGAPAAVLSAFSRDVDLVVVGRRGAGESRHVLGSVSSATAARARVAVAVVPATAQGVRPSRIVVGVSFEHDLTRALALAFVEGGRCDAPVKLVHAIQPLTQLAHQGGAATPPDLYQELQELLDVWSARYPGVACSVEARRGDPAGMLLAQVTAADLLVVGGRHHSRLVGRMLGSVPDAVLVDAPGVVVVTHAPTLEAAPDDRRAVGPT